MADDMAAAIEEAVRLADEAGPGAGVLIAGSVYAAGEARAMLVRPGEGS
jgi:dihydrofolate synthase/folylpolyglutamate synthase